MARRIEIAVPNQIYRRIEDLAGAADMKVTEFTRMALRRVLSDPDGFLVWLNGPGAQAARAEADAGLSVQPDGVDA